MKDTSSRPSASARATNDINDLTQDETRVRSNIQSLNNVSGQQDLVQQYARQLSQIETKLNALRETQNQLRRTGATLQSDLNQLMERIDF